MNLALRVFGGAWIACALFAGLSSTVPADGRASSDLFAGVGKVILTPPVGHPIRAQGKLASVGTLDPLYARILTLRAGDSQVAWISIDLQIPFGPDQMSWLRSETKRQTGISILLLTATHNHSAPTIRRVYASGAVPEWERKALKDIVEGITDAQKRMVPVRMGTGWGLSYVGYNRRSADSYTTGFQFDRRKPKADSYPIDPTVGVIRLDRLEGKPLAILANYACHPVILGPDNRKFSAEFPGVLTDLVERHWGKSPVCLFLQGAAGNINPHRADIKEEESALKEVQGVGESLGQEVLRICQQIETHAAAQASIKVRAREITFGSRWTAEAIKAAAERGPLLVDRFWLPPLGKPVHTMMTTLLINDEVAMVALPGEPFVEFQMELRRRSPLEATFLVGYTNDHVGYLPTIEAAATGGFGADNLGTTVEVGAGERMIDLALVDLYYLLGRLKPYPGQGRGDVPARAPLK